MDLTFIYDPFNFRTTTDNLRKAFLQKRRRVKEQGEPIEPEWKDFYRFCNRSEDEELSSKAVVNLWCYEESERVLKKRREKGTKLEKQDRQEEKKYQREINIFKRKLVTRSKNARAAVLTILGLKKFRNNEHAVLRELHEDIWTKIAHVLWSTRKDKIWDTRKR